MNRRIRRSCTLALALLLTVLPAADAEYIELPAALDALQEEAFAGDTEIIEVTVPDGTTAIGDRAFANCTALELVYIPNSVTEIGENVFEGCDLSILEIDCKEGSTAYAYATANGLQIATPVVYRGLVIGQGYAGTGITQLHGTFRDADAIASALSQFPGTPYSILRRNDLTASGILSEIRSSFADADRNDVSLFYYSGHGTGTGALVGTDLGGYVTARALRNCLDTIPGKKIVLIDACFSGNMIGKDSGTAGAQSSEFAGDFNSSFISAFTSRAKSSTDLADSGYYVITASSGTETSMEVSAQADPGGPFVYVGLFTVCLTEGLGWDEIGSAPYGEIYADENNDGRVSFDEAAGYAVETVDYVAKTYLKAVQSVQVYPENCTRFYLAAK